MLILICGDRNWTDAGAIRRQLLRFNPVYDVILHGSARGADTIAGTEAARIGFKVIAVPAKWNKYGRAAGPIRNVEMLGHKPGLVMAFHPDLNKSKGTAHMVKIARAGGVTVEVHSVVSE